MIILLTLTAICFICTIFSLLNARLVNTLIFGFLTVAGIATTFLCAIGKIVFMIFSLKAFVGIILLVAVVVVVRKTVFNR